MPEQTTSLNAVLKQTQQQTEQTTNTTRNARPTPLPYFLSDNDNGLSIKRWLSELASAKSSKQFTAEHWLQRQIAQIDKLINKQINQILHNNRFQQLESGWRGLLRLVDHAGIDLHIKIKVLDVSWKELSRDIERAPDFDQSALFNIVYNQEFGTPGGEPYSVLLGNYEVSHRPFEGHRYDDTYTLKGISQTAAAAFAPFICGAAPQLFGLDDFDSTLR